MQRLRRENQRLTEQLRKAEAARSRDATLAPSTIAAGWSLGLSVDGLRRRGKGNLMLLGHGHEMLSAFV